MRSAVDGVVLLLGDEEEDAISFTGEEFIFGEMVFISSGQFVAINNAHCLLTLFHQMFNQVIVSISQMLKNFCLCWISFHLTNFSLLICIDIQEINWQDITVLCIV